MALVRWDPFKELEEMSARLNRVFSPPVKRTLVHLHGFRLSCLYRMDRQDGGLSLGTT